MQIVWFHLHVGSSSRLLMAALLGYTYTRAAACACVCVCCSVCVCVCSLEAGL
jgi:hypothetical protein